MKTMEIKKGISLIVLVITIVVMIILATVVILTLDSSNIIERANEAKSKTNLSNIKQSYLLARYNAMLEGETDQEKIIKSAFPDLDYNSNFAEVRGKITYIGDSEEMKEVLFDNGILSMEPEIVSYAQILDSSFILNNGYMTGLWNESASNAYTGDELAAKLPAGSRVVKLVDGEYVDLGTTLVGTGYIILDANGNHIAYTVFFGDMNGDCKINIVDLNMVKIVISGKNPNYVSYGAGDIIEDGRLDQKDIDFILEITVKKTPINKYKSELGIDQHRPVSVKISW